MVVGRLLSYWGGPFSGAMLNFGGGSGEGVISARTSRLTLKSNRGCPHGQRRGNETCAGMGGRELPGVGKLGKVSKGQKYPQFETSFCRAFSFYRGLQQCGYFSN